MKFEENMCTTLEPLNEREKQIARLIFKGCKSEEIAETLGLRKSTVSFYTESIRNKLGAKNKIQIINILDKNNHLL
jgi:DNA-binding NarL/FixJ family response regulator